MEDAIFKIKNNNNNTILKIMKEEIVLLMSLKLFINIANSLHMQLNVCSIFHYCKIFINILVIIKKSLNVKKVD